MANLIPQLLELPAETILEALGEYEELGEGGFLDKYPPYKPAEVHFGVYGDLQFPPRAILAAAYFHAHGRIPDPEEGPRNLSVTQLREIFSHYGMKVVTNKAVLDPDLRVPLRIEKSESVLKAIREFDQLGRDKFLARYGFGRAKSYYILNNGRVYDSKAIAGVARGFDSPSLTPLAHNQFSGGEHQVAKLMRKLGFTIVTEVPGELDAPLVLVQNGQNEGASYDSGDAIGERFRFSNRFKSKVKTGKRFVYCSQSMEDGATPTYFGWGMIGEISEDPEAADAPRDGEYRWICTIDDYTPFAKPVPFKVNDIPFEDIPRNLWSVAVRVLGEGVFEKILVAAGPSSEIDATSNTVQQQLPPIENVAARIASVGLLRPIKPPGRSGSGYSGSTRRSKFSKELGDRGEEVVLDHLRKNLSDDERSTLRWAAQEGEKNGWDIEYQSKGKIVGIEVKATGGSYFPSIELTANEWDAAREKRSDYKLALVSRVRTEKPQVEIIDDPFGEVAAGVFGVEPLSWRFVRREEI
jgi:hypothetical protein